MQSVKKEGHKESNKIAAWPIIMMAEQNKNINPDTSIVAIQLLTAKGNDLCQLIQDNQIQPTTEA